MKPAAYIADHLRTVLQTGGSAPHTEEVQRFFKHEIVSRGWYTAELRKLARRFTRVIKNDAGLPYLVEVADLLFSTAMFWKKRFSPCSCSNGDGGELWRSRVPALRALAQTRRLMGRS